MTNKRPQPEEIITKLRQVEVVGDDYVVLLHRGNLACHNGSERSLMVGSPCYTAAVWDDELKTFNSPFSAELVLGVSEFEP